MGLARSTYYDEPKGQPPEEAQLVARIMEVCAEWPRYGYRRVTAQLHNEGLIIKHKKGMRLMKENGLSVRPRRRFMVTTDSSHNGPIFPKLTKTAALSGPDQLWVADITYSSERMPKQYPTISIRIISSGSTEGRPMSL